MGIDIDKRLIEMFPSKFDIEVNSGNKGYKYNFGRTSEFTVKTIENGKVINEVKESIDKENYVQDDLGGVQNYKSLGNLVCLRAYTPYYDDWAGMHWFENNGFVVLDKNLNVVYKSKKEDRENRGKISNQNAALKLLYKYGPCALAHLDEDLIKDDKFVDLAQKTFDKRVKMLQTKHYAEEKINSEKQDMSKVVDYLKTKAAEREARFGRIF